MNDLIILWGEFRNFQIIFIWVFVKICVSEGVVCFGFLLELLIEEVL